MCTKAHTPGEVRHNQSDESDEPRRGDCRRSEKGGDQEGSASGALDVHPERRGGVLTERENIDLSRPVHKCTTSRQDARRQPRHPLPRRVSRRTHHPPEGAANIVRRGLRQRDHDSGVGEGADNYTGDEQSADVASRALAARDRRALDGLAVDYFEEADFEPRVLAAAVRVGSTRLIDNVVLEGDTE